MTERRMLTETNCGVCGRLMRTVPHDDAPRCVFCVEEGDD